MKVNFLKLLPKFDKLLYKVCFYFKNNFAKVDFNLPIFGTPRNSCPLPLSGESDAQREQKAKYLFFGLK